MDDRPYGFAALAPHVSPPHWRTCRQLPVSGTVMTSSRWPYGSSK
jgi:hypothetical protein